MRRPQVDPFQYHELLDRLYLFTAMLDTYIMQHPATKINREVKQNVEQAIQHLSIAYQLVGGITIGEDE
jgi:hypothetical protein